MIYNFPSVTAGIDLDSDILVALSRHPNIVGCKLSCGNVGKLIRIARYTDDHPQHAFAAFIGKSEVFLPSIEAGGAGLIGALVNVVPRMHVHVWKNWKTYSSGIPSEETDDDVGGFGGPRFDAMVTQQLLSCADWQSQKLGGIGGIKAIVHDAFGYGSRRVRLPLVPVSDERFSASRNKDTELRVAIDKEKEIMQGAEVLQMEWPDYHPSATRFFGT